MGTHVYRIENLDVQVPDDSKSIELQKKYRTLAGGCFFSVSTLLSYLIAVSQNRLNISSEQAQIT